MYIQSTRATRKGQEAVLIYEYKVAGHNAQYAAIDEAIRAVQFIRNKCLRKWMDERGVSRHDLAISRFYENCREHKPGKKGYPRQKLRARKEHQ